MAKIRPENENSTLNLQRFGKFTYMPLCTTDHSFGEIVSNRTITFRMKALPLQGLRKLEAILSHYFPHFLVYKL